MSAGVLRFVSISIVLLALAGCNQNTNNTSASPGVPAAGKPASATSGERDACTLVTKAEAEAMMGEHLKDGEAGPASMRGGSICMYESPDSSSARHISIRLEAPTFDWNKYKEDQRIEGEKMRPKRGYVRPVPGLGKDAYFSRHTLHVLTDKGTLTVIVFKDTADAIAGEETETKAETAEKTLAGKALSRM